MTKEQIGLNVYCIQIPEQVGKVFFLSMASLHVQLCVYFCAEWGGIGWGRVGERREIER